MHLASSLSKNSFLELYFQVGAREPWAGGTFSNLPAVGGEWKSQSSRVGTFLGGKVKKVNFAWGGNQP